MLKKTLLNFFILLFTTACSPDSGTSGSNIYNFFVFKQFFLDINKNIVLEYNYNFSDDIKYVKFNTNSIKLEEVNITTNPISQEVISFRNNRTIVKNEHGVIVFELVPPTIEEIESITGVNLPNSIAYYNVFKSTKEYKWNRKTYVVNVGIEKLKRDNNSLMYTFREVHCFYLFYDDINFTWSIVYIGKRPDIVDGLDYHEDDLNLYIESYSPQRIFIDGNISLCHNWAGSSDKRCFIKNADNTLDLKKLYGEILPVAYRTILDKLYNSEAFRSPSPSLYFFDNHHNLNIFYNDVQNAKGEYFRYIMYKKENPSIAIYEQDYRSKQ